MPFEPVILFLIPGLSAGLVRSDLKMPGVLDESLSIFLLLAIVSNAASNWLATRWPIWSARLIVEHLKNRCYASYGKLSFLLDVQVLRPEKF